ncbi:MAG: nicotinate (nicotinamide) nucleotide adenylyltransferase [Bacteroides sp.]|nr:nicotinate (nicotinamide) nucleotide adenylyltransferase [Bacteroides sp.]
MLKKKTVLFFGSFNPIHIGHTAIANYICECQNIDELWFVVSPQNPFKDKKDLWSNEARLSLVQKATSGYSKMKASDVEFTMPLPSYTYHTLKKLEQNFPDREFILLIGSDNWIKFQDWKNYEDIISNHHIMIYPRKGYNISDAKLPITRNITIVDAPEIEISSTYIRKAIDEDKNLTFFVPYGVWDMIVKMKANNLL